MLARIKEYFEDRGVTASNLPKAQQERNRLRQSGDLPSVVDPVAQARQAGGHPGKALAQVQALANIPGRRRPRQRQ